MPDLVAMLAPDVFGRSTARRAKSKIDATVQSDQRLMLTLVEIRSKPFQDAIKNPMVAPKILPKIDNKTLQIIRREGLAPKVPDSEQGADRAFRDAGLKSRRRQIQILSAVYTFLKSLGKRKSAKFQDGQLKVDPAQVAKNAIWTTASTAIPGLRIAKSIAEKVIKAMIKRLKIWYNNNCGGKAGRRIADFRSVGGGGRQKGRCQAGLNEPGWIDTGFRPYVWKTAVSTSKWSYSPLGWSQDKKDIKTLLEARKRRRKKPPPKWKKKGSKNLRPLPAVL